MFCSAWAILSALSGWCCFCRFKKVAFRADLSMPNATGKPNNSKKLLVIKAMSYTVKDSPQPHSPVWLGLVNLKPEFSPSVT
ncbi:hypothetical protein [Moraxella lacunata]|uniref:hypothetical protein n=1 Tax=Moraxella lacunata TaxID=477 RepID=UPI003EE0A37A